MKQNKSLEVYDGNRKVGTLAITAKHQVAFQYCEEWLANGFAISPFSLPLKEDVFVPAKANFGGLFGVFADSLPDAWGRLLVDRFLREQGENPAEMTSLDRLAIVGENGMGALIYRPSWEQFTEEDLSDLDMLAARCKAMLISESTEGLDELYRLGGTSGGARPKITTRLVGEDWMIKFPAHTDMASIGEMEFAYSKCARSCGIEMSETKLFPSKICSGYFGTKRFDRRLVDAKIRRIHVITAAALLELDFTQPSLDYHELMKLTKILTKDDSKDVENMFRRMCFNVFAHNRDDHSKNFSYLYEEDEERWHLAPAYDLTYSNTYFGEHTTSVDGNGVNPGREEMLKVGVSAGLKRGRCLAIMDEIFQKVNEMLKEYL